MPVVNIINLKKRFQDQEVIKGLDFQLSERKCIALLGANGAGKTTTLKMLAGLVKPDSGSIVFEGSEKADFRRLIGYLPQFPVFYEWMTGNEFLEYAGQLAGLSKSEAKDRAKELLELTGIAEAKNRRIGKYSGGMNQRLGIAQAIIHRPKLVMLDEPVSALDPFGRREVLELMDKLKKESAILFSTHILNDAEEICDEILFLHNGELVESGTLAGLRTKHQQAKIDLAFKENTLQYAEELSLLQPVSSMKLDGEYASFLVEDIEYARELFLTEIMKRNLPLVKFEISRTRLEDVFMKVVQK
ncbi:ABC transporter ATP-binding protein [Cytobacillus firmus]|uniref:ABC transporter ATP-binding protein n=1 Tax=Cytobacillus TaxID=2675230 RepID=UPI00204020F3|nr:ABC transporter ATP-binding protein [Cytobacillus oceanisediminis]MCM3243402.1 ABC transporter ATP-binding protein [Cytobacillus oceanisediminis]MCS0826975.1 ABC transporter ATP-binding protein [Cytobacillus firmus]